MLAAYGVHSLVEGSTLASFRRGLGVAVLVLLAVAVWVSLAEPPGAQARTADDLWLAVLLGGLLLGVTAGGLRAPSATWGLAALALVALDLGGHASRAGVLAKGTFEPKPKLGAGAVAELLDGADEYRVYDEFALGWRSGSRTGMRDFRGYKDPLRLARYDLLLEGLGARPELLQKANVRHVLHARHPYHGLGHHHVKAPARIHGAKKLGQGGHLYELAAPDPYAYWVGGVETVEGASKAVAALAALDTKRRALVVAADAAGEARSQAVDDAQERVPAAVVDRGPNHVTLDVSAPASGWLVVNEAWFPGWVAEVGGASVAPIRANVMFQAVPIGPGAQRVTLAFRPTGFLVGAALAVAIWLALAALAAASMFQAAIRRYRPS